MTDVMDQGWCCLVCSEKFSFGDLVTKPASTYLHCPRCGGTDIHSADGSVKEVDSYFGAIGTMN